MKTLHDAPLTIICYSQLTIRFKSPSSYFSFPGGLSEPFGFEVNAAPFPNGFGMNAFLMPGLGGTRHTESLTIALPNNIETFQPQDEAVDSPEEITQLGSRTRLYPRERARQRPRRRHNVRPSGELGPTACPKCHYTASTRRDVKRHIEAVHERKKPFRCPVPNCSRSIDGFSRDDLRKRHMRTVHEAHSAHAESAANSSSPLPSPKSEGEVTGDEGDDQSQLLSPVVSTPEQGDFRRLLQEEIVRRERAEKEILHLRERLDGIKGLLRDV